jgi:hypothetical protein
MTAVLKDGQKRVMNNEDQESSLKIGRIVHYRNPSGTVACRPSIVVRVSDPSTEQIELLPFPSAASGVTRSPREGRGSDFRPGTWHWPTECPEGL